MNAIEGNSPDEAIRVIKAFKLGKEIEFKPRYASREGWRDAEDFPDQFDFSEYIYRLKLKKLRR